MKLIQQMYILPKYNDTLEVWKMDLRQLRYFHTIAKEGQVTRAADKLHMAQPPLSHSLKVLEEEIGIKLLERNGRKMELTDAGEVLYSKVEFLFKYLEETMTEVRETEEGIKGHFTIGCVKTCFSLMPSRMEKFRENYPNVTFELREGDSYALVEQLKNRDIDLAIVRLPFETEIFSSHFLPEEKYVAIMSESLMPLNNRNSISMRELANLPLILLRRIKGKGQFELVSDRFRNRGLDPNIVTVCPDVDMIMELVSRGLGASIVPESTLNKHMIGDVKSLSIKDELIISQSAIIWLKDRYLSKTAERFIELFK